MSAKRGQCSVCRFRFRLRKDGTVQEHHLYSGHDRAEEPCAGSGKRPRPFDPNECADCMMHIGRAAVPGGSVRVGRDRRGKSTEAMLWDYLVQFHERKHQEAA